MDNFGHKIVCVGVTHHKASIAHRERLALNNDSAQKALLTLFNDASISELTAVPTCNRSEIYLSGNRSEDMILSAFNALQNLSSLTSEELHNLLEIRIGSDAVEHLMRTAGGIESVVIGEQQIQGQLRVALENAKKTGTCGQVLDKLFRSAIESGKKARTKTSIDSGRASIGSVAAQLIIEQFGDLTGAHIAVLGAGKMGSLAAKSIIDRGASYVDIVNRSKEKANHLVDQCGGQGIGVTIDDLDKELEVCDVLLSATDAPHIVISPEFLKKVMKRRDNRPLLLVDLAVPRDIDAACNSLDNVQLFDLDDLESVVNRTIGVRSTAIKEVEEISSVSSKDFMSWLSSLKTIPKIVNLREKAQAYHQEQFNYFVKNNPHLKPRELTKIKQVSRVALNKSLHKHIARIKESSEIL